uniref:F-box protein 22 n=1 Tax=Xiphophorus couchianus TaxID=32473 RepID=A0A3B5LWR9_9TELE
IYKKVQQRKCRGKNSKAAYVLSNVAEVVERVLMFIPTKSLLQVASVCRLWRNCARRVLRTQQHLTWVSSSGPCTTELHSFCSILAEEVEKVFLLPKTVLMMVDCEALTGQAYCYEQSKAKKSRQCMSTAEELNQIFPKGCDIVGIATPGIVLTPTGSWTGAPKEYQEGEAGFAVMLPNTDGVHIKPFHFFKRNPILSSLLYFVLLFFLGLVDNPELRVVVMFIYEAYKSGGARFLSQILEPLTNSKALIIGCDRIVKDDYTLCNSDSDTLQHEYTTVMTLVHFG